jgi:hypothetical protein
MDVLVGLVLTLAIVGGIMYFMAKQSEQALGVDPGGHSKNAAASDAVCRTNLDSVRNCVMAAKAADPEGRCPPSLDQVSGVTDSMKKCPVGDEPYVYDPATGQVHCQHAGHESY